MLNMKNIAKIGLKILRDKVFLYIIKLKNEAHKKGARTLTSRFVCMSYMTITIISGKNNKINWII